MWFILIDFCLYQIRWFDSQFVEMRICETRSKIFVGQYVGSGYRRPDFEILKPIQELQGPVTQKQLRSMLVYLGIFMII